MDFDPELILQCADDSLQPAIVERFIQAVGAPALSVTVTIDGKPLLLPKISSSIEAADVVAQYVGKADVRFGVTQYPAGVGEATASAIDETLFDPCTNIAMGTGLFAGVYGSVTPELGPDSPQAFENALGIYLDSSRKPAAQQSNNSHGGSGSPAPPISEGAAESNASDSADPFKAEIRIELPKLDE